MAILPPVKPPIYWLQPFYWCQIEFVFFHELQRMYPKVSAIDVYKEATEVAKALKSSGQPLSLGAEPDEVNWEQLICAANSYAHMDDDHRASVRKELANGAKPWAILAVLSEPDLCDMAVLEDREYLPSPSCVPKDAITAAEVGGSIFLFSIGAMFLFRALTSP